MTQFGRYQDLEEAGRGGFATVYKARDPKLNRLVALKVLHAGYGSDPAFVERFQQEAQTVARFSHPNIVTIYEVGEEERQLFIAMEFLSSGDLQAWLNLKEKPLTVDEALPFLTPMASALDYAHKQGVVHRDIKPSNMMLQQTGDEFRVVLTDFGLVKAMENSVALTMTNMMLGSPEYMAPEQADPNRNDEIGPHTDLYAFGIVTYQMLTGRVPFPGHSSSTLYAQEYKPVPPPQELNKTLLPAIADILVKMLSKSPTDRYKTATAFVQALQTTLETASQDQQREAKVASLYKNLLKAKETNNWFDVITLAAQIEIFIPNYKDVSVLNTEAQNQLQAPQQQIPSILNMPETSQQVSPSTSKRWWRKKTKSGSDPSLEINTSSHPKENNLAKETKAKLSAVSNPEPSPVQMSGEKNIKPKPKRQKREVPTWIKLGGIILVSIIVIGSGYAIINSLSQNTKLGDTWKRPVDGMVEIYVPKRTFPITSFQMGSDDGDSDEQPIHNVALDAFWIDKTEVTNEQYALCVADGICERSKFFNNSSFNGDRQPVVGVDWYNAGAYCQWVRRRLPTEAEWEYAARGSKSITYPWGDSSPSCNLLNYNMCIGKTAVVGSYSPEGDSWVRVSDMAGNVWEWVNDWYEDDYYANSSSKNPAGPSAGASKVVRGGSYNHNTYNVRSSNRFPLGPTTKIDALGFRCATSNN